MIIQLETDGDAYSCGIVPLAQPLSSLSPASRAVPAIVRSGRPAMHRVSSAQRADDDAPRRARRGVEWELYPDHIMYFAVASTGQRIAGVRVPIRDGDMTGECEAICYLADALDAADPLPHAGAVPLGRPYLRLVSHAAPPRRADR